MTPPLPLIALTDKYLELVDSSYPLNQATAIGLIRQKKDYVKYFDNTGTFWTSELKSSNFKSTLFTKLLANTFYNPKLTVERTWTKQGDYNLIDLKEKICNCVDRDDDNLPQFINADTFKVLIQNCLSFTDIIEVLIKYVYYPEFED